MPDDLDSAAEWGRSALEASGLPVDNQPYVVGDRRFRKTANMKYTVYGMR